MPDDQKDAAEKPTTTDASCATATPEAVTKEAKEGEQDLTKSVVDYFKARKDGLRDKWTLENLPPQPQFFDSAQEGGKPATTVMVGKMATEYSLPEIGKKASDIAKKVGEAASGAADGISEAGKKAGEAVSDLGKKIKESVSGDETVPRAEKPAEAAKEPTDAEKEAKRIEDMGKDTAKNEAKEKLNKSLDEHVPPLSDEKKAEFRKNMEDFEKRAAQKGLPPEEVAKTYTELGKILDAKGDKPISPEMRAQVAEQVMDHAAHPTDVNQGQHQTCNVAVVESMMYSKNPSAAAHMMAEISTKGEYTGQDGTHVKLNPLCFQPDAEAKANGPSDRNYASQLFQVTAVNLQLQKHHPDQEYVQRPTPLSGKTIGLGEQILDKKSGQPIMDGPGKPHDFSAGFSTEKVAETYNMIHDKDKTTGKPEHFDVGLTAPPYSDQPVHATGIESEEKLNTKLAELKRDGKLPVAVWVHTSGEPFWSDSGGGSAGGAGGDTGGGHYVTVTDYEPGPPARVAVDNQWGKSADHEWKKNPDGSVDKSKSVSAHDLFVAMHDPGDQADLLKKDVDANKAAGKVDTVKELDSLRMQRMSGQIDSAEYAKQVTKCMSETQARWEKERNTKPDSTLNPKEQKETAQKFKDAVNFLPAKERMQVLGQVNDDIMTPAERKQAIEDTTVSLLQDKASKIYQGKYTEQEKKDFAKANEQLKEMLDKMPADKREEILKAIAARAPKGTPKLS